MKFLYTVGFEDGNKVNVVSTIDGIYKVVSKLQVSHNKKITSIAYLGDVEELYEYGENASKNTEALHAEIAESVYRIEESLAGIKVGELGTYLAKTLSVELGRIKELIKS